MDGQNNKFSLFDPKRKVQMDLTTNISNNQQAKDLLEAQAHLWSIGLSYYNSMALKCAIQLGIPDAIHKHGKPITLLELANSLAINLNKTPSLSRLMRLLVHSNLFTMNKSTNGEDVFILNINSQLLLKDHPFTLVPFVLFLFEPTIVDPSKYLSTWFLNEEESPFHVAHGRSIWEHTGLVPEFNKFNNQAMANDARFVAELLVKTKEFEEVLKGVESLVDVGGGTGTTAKVIAKAYPGLSCIVLDLPHVVESSLDVNVNNNITFVGGDMFQAIPPANAVLLKWILHDWSDDHCVEILKRCKESIPSKELGGKVIIIHMVVETKYNHEKYSTTQLLFDMLMMSLNIGGKERTEEEWKKLFTTAGFNEYKILQILGLRSVIEIYPA